MKRIPLLYEDDHIAVLNKPPGILTIPDRYDPTKRNIKDIFDRKWGEIFIVHRLDRDTSGALMVAKDKETHRLLSLGFQHRQIDKHYLAFVQGEPPIEEGKIEVNLSQRPDGKMLVVPKGKHSISYFRLRERFRFHSLLELKLVTGRTHQARVHVSHLGCPLLIDPVYGSSTSFFVSSIKRKYNLSKGEEERPLLSRIPLHASMIQCIHPHSKDQLSISAPFPKDLRALHKQLSKWSSIEQ